MDYHSKIFDSKSKYSNKTFKYVADNHKSYIEYLIKNKHLRPDSKKFGEFHKYIKLLLENDTEF